MSSSWILLVGLQQLISPSPACPWSLTAPRRALTCPFIDLLMIHTDILPQHCVALKAFIQLWRMSLGMQGFFFLLLFHKWNKNLADIWCHHMPSNFKPCDKMDVWCWMMMAAWMWSSLMWWICHQTSGAGVLLEKQWIWSKRHTCLFLGDCTKIIIYILFRPTTVSALFSWNKDQDQYGQFKRHIQVDLISFWSYLSQNWSKLKCVT